MSCRSNLTPAAEERVAKTEAAAWVIASLALLALCAAGGFAIVWTAVFG